MKIYAIPGLGTTAAIFEGIKIKNHELIVLKWPALKREYTMAAYAASFKDQINTSEPFMLMGLSFGGMLSAELGKIISPEKIILISTAKTRDGLSWPIRFFKYLPLHLIIPDKCFRWLSYNSRLLLGFLVDYMPRLSEMIKEMPENYFRYSIHYIVNWNNKTVPENCILIHGTSDKLIWFKKQFVDFAVPKGSHAMVITRAGEINEILEGILADKQ
ncbi:MAG: alpha/beta hydrolase [Bacteroidetes bacterium]|nr:alpha/beta hydrolase [Bacteroidota bacterium]